mmetsp:Transcript_34757/g.90929  ORF Transcript_34757/g.90929 Transcript_34757/m.90929 type:complete len:259 (+) Transcript_34757:622-1398(+)
MAFVISSAARLSVSNALLNLLVSAVLIARSSCLSCVELPISYPSSLIWACRSVSSVFMVSMAALAFSMSRWRSSLSFLFLFSEFWQRSRCSMSIASSLRNRAIIESMSAMTLSKYPRVVAAVAILATAPLRYILAMFCSAAMPLLPTRLLEDTCSSVVEEFVKTATDSSLLRISTALSRPWSSSVRRRTRSLHTLAFSWQPSLVVAKKASSAFSCSWVSSRRSLLSAICLALVALSNSCLSNVSESVASSALLVPMSS